MTFSHSLEICLGDENTSAANCWTSGTSSLNKEALLKWPISVSLGACSTGATFSSSPVTLCKERDSEGTLVTSSRSSTIKEALSSSFLSFTSPTDSILSRLTPSPAICFGEEGTSAVTSITNVSSSLYSEACRSGSANWFTSKISLVGTSLSVSWEICADVDGEQCSTSSTTVSSTTYKEARDGLSATVGTVVSAISSSYSAVCSLRWENVSSTFISLRRCLRTSVVISSVTSDDWSSVDVTGAWS